jgi:hypothetical protein
MQRTANVAERASRYLAVLAFSAAMVLGSVVSGAGFTGTAASLDTTTLELDRDGADISPVDEKPSARGLDMTMLYLDRDGADSPTGNWWDPSSYAAARPADAPSIYRGPDITGLNLDRDGADAVAG